MRGDDVDGIYSSGYNDGYVKGFKEGYAENRYEVEIDKAKYIRQGYEEGYAQAKRDAIALIEEEQRVHREQARKILDIPHNPNRRPTKINTDRTDAKRKEDTRRLLNGE